MTKKELQTYAENMQIAMTEEETETIQSQINNILDYVSLIEKFDLNCNEKSGNCEENSVTVTADYCNKFREDIAAPSIPIAQALKNAPKKNENFFKVPKQL